jgi:hypothetical protein
MPEAARVVKTVDDIDVPHFVNVGPAPFARGFCNPALPVRFNVSGLGAELPAKMEIRAMRSS